MLGTALLYFLFVVGWLYGLVAPDADAALVVAVFVAINVGFGVAVGRWQVTLLALVIVVGSLPLAGESYEGDTTGFDVALFVAAVATVLLAAGVDLRRIAAAVSSH